MIETTEQLFNFAAIDPVNGKAIGCDTFETASKVTKDLVDKYSTEGYSPKVLLHCMALEFKEPTDLLTLKWITR